MNSGKQQQNEVIDVEQFSYYTKTVMYELAMETEHLYHLYEGVSTIKNWVHKDAWHIFDACIINGFMFGLYRIPCYNNQCWEKKFIQGNVRNNCKKNCKHFESVIGRYYQLRDGEKDD